MLPVRDPEAATPQRGGLAALLDKFRGIAANFRDRAERLREGVAAGRTPATFAVPDTVAQLDAWLAGPIGDDPLLQTGDTARDRGHRRLAARVARGRRERHPPGDGRATATSCATRSGRTPGPTSVPA